MFTEIELLPLPWLFQIEQSLPIYGGPFFLVQRGHKEENSTTSTWATAKKNICCVRINHPWCEISCDQHKRARTSNILTTRLHSCLHGAKSTAEHQVSHKQNYAKRCKTTIKSEVPGTGTPTSTSERRGGSDKQTTKSLKEKVHGMPVVYTQRKTLINEGKSSQYRRFMEHHHSVSLMQCMCMYIYIQYTFK